MKPIIKHLILILSLVEFVGLNASADTPVAGFSPWDLALVLPNEVPSQEALNARLKITDLGYSEAEVKAMIDHISQKFILQESLNADSDGLSEFKNGNKILGGPLNDRVAHNSSNPPAPLTIVDSFGQNALNCFHDVNSWRASQMRIAPYKIQPPGTPSVYSSWAASQRQAIDRIIQVRIAFRPYCKTGNKFTALEQALHFAFELKPNDSHLVNDANYLKLFNNNQNILNNLANSVWGNAGSFANNSRNNKKPDAMKALQAHLNAVNSDEYNKFRRYVFNDLAQFSQIRSAYPISSFKILNDVTDELRSNLLFSQDVVINPEMRSFAHPAFMAENQTGDLLPQSGKMLAQFKRFAIKYATRGNVTAIAGFLTETTASGPKSFYSNFGMGAYSNVSSLKGEAGADYSLLHPNAMNTTTAELQDNGTFIKLSSAKTSDFYAQADAIGVAPTGEGSKSPNFAFRLIDAANAKPNLINEVDFFSQISIKDEGHGNRHVDFSPAFPDRGSVLYSELEKYSNPNKTLPSSTSCVSCHTLPRSGLAATGLSNADSALLLKPTFSKFILLDEHSLTARSVRELDREFIKLNLEWTQSTKTRCDNIKAFRDCLDDIKDTNACIDKICN